MLFGLIGAEAQSLSLNVDAGYTLNFIPEIVESGDGATKIALYPSPGLTTFATLSGSAVRGMYAFNGRLFAVADNFNEIHADGSVTAYSFLPVDGNPVTMAANNVNQLLICAAGELWMFPLVAVNTANIVSTQGFAPFRNPAYIQVTLSSNPFSVGQVVYFSGLTTVTALNGQSLAINYISGNIIEGRWTSATPTLPYGPTADTGTVSTAAIVPVTSGLVGAVASIGFIDGFFIALIKNSQTFQISNVEDALTWNPANAADIGIYADNVVSMFVDHDQAWFFGSKKTVPYYDTGDLLNPFQEVPGAIIEQGCGAEFSVSRLDNAICWIGQDELGAGIAWRAQGYLPIRISTHYVENIWRNYSTISDAIGYSYQENGHTFWVLYFPTANATWVYDASAPPNMRWTQRGFLSNGQILAHRSRCQAQFNGKIYVGDTSSGHIYQQSISLPYDDVSGASNSPIQSIRRSAHIQKEKQRLFHEQLQIDLETGNAPAGVQPQLAIRWSNDSGHSWSNYYSYSAGLTGETRKRVIRWQLGQARDRVYEISTTDYWAKFIVDGYVQVSPQ